MKPISDFERSDYPDMVPPTELRNLAEALEASNHDAEQTSALFKRVLEAKSKARSITDCYCEANLLCPPTSDRSNGE
jgi:hypothetical protein